MQYSSGDTDRGTSGVTSERRTESRVEGSTEKRSDRCIEPSRGARPRGARPSRESGEPDGQRAGSFPPLERFNIIGRSAPMLDALDAIATLGQFDAPVLITGETGTGKELAARGLHYGGLRADKPFTALNCATFTDDLFASEIFGHKRGAFTDAREEKRGLLAAARGGSLFLDEVDSLSLKSQAALLRFLQAMEYRPVGSETVYKADVRIIASCNCDLDAQMSQGSFRRDLYYRLCIFNIHMPSLRDRREDIAVLAHHFLQQFDHQYKLGKRQLSAPVLCRLTEYDWPGNVRELENLVHRLYLSATGPDIDVDVVHRVSPCREPAGGGQPEHRIDAEPAQPGPVGAEQPPEVADENREDFDFSRDKRQAIEAFERRYVARLLECADGNVTRAAKLCGKERRALGKLVKKYGLKP